MLPNRLQKWMLASLLLLATFCTSAQERTSILFIGNSYTYYYNMPLMVEELAESQGLAWDVESLTAGGARWSHWLEHLQNKEYDEFQFVVLQNNSMSTIDSPEQFQSDGKAMIGWAQQHGAVPLLFETWARRDNPAMQSTITREYESLGSQMGVNTVPVGQMWQILRNKRPDLALYDPDGSHPSPIGAYVVACMFYGTFTGKSTQNLPSEITTTANDGKTPYVLQVAADDAAFVQREIDQFLELTEQ